MTEEDVSARQVPGIVWDLPVLNVSRLVWIQNQCLVSNRCVILPLEPRFAKSFGKIVSMVFAQFSEKFVNACILCFRQMLVFYEA